jgi:hypothetical protein
MSSYLLYLLTEGSCDALQGLEPQLYCTLSRIDLAHLYKHYDLALLPPGSDRKKVSERGILTHYQMQREGEVRMQKGREQAKGTYELSRREGERSHTTEESEHTGGS